MTQGQEQEQLLEDASTLLMFASSAAARQRSPPHPAPENATQADQASFQRPSAAQKNDEMGSATRDVESASPDVAPGQVPANLVPMGARHMYSNSATQGPHSAHLQAPQRHPHNALPHLKTLVMAGQAPPNVDPRLPASQSYNYPSQALPKSRAAPVLTPAQTHQNSPISTHGNAHTVPHAMYGYYGIDPATAGIPVGFSRIYNPAYPDQNTSNMQNGPQIPRRQSLAPSSPFKEELLQKHKFRKTQSASPQEGVSTSVPHKLVPLSPKPPTEHRAFEPGLHNQALPARGSFVPAHKRTVSETSQKRPSITSPTASPGLSVPFARGINVESGKRNTDNAMIAAAALAAAADIPFPLKNKEKQGKSDKSGPGPQKPHRLGPAMKVTDAGSVGGPLGPNNVKDDESVVTEPEEDENKTEDEPVYSARESYETMDMPVHTGAPGKTGFPETGAVSEGVPLPKNERPKEEPETDPTPSKKAEKYNIPVQIPIPPLSSFKVDPDAGTIGCICGIEEDDGFTIQCDVCFRWQHCSCMGYLTNEEVPEDEYKCYYCDEMKWNKIDPDQCRIATIARLEQEKSNDGPEKGVPENMPEKAPKRKTSSSGNDEKKRRKSEKDVKPVVERPPEKRKSSSAASPNSKSAVPVEIHNKENPLLEDGTTAEPYQGLYYRLEENDYKTPEVRNRIREVGRRCEESRPFALETMSLSQFKLIKFSKISLPNHQKYLQERNELRRSKGSNKTTIKVRPYSENPKQKFVSVTKTGLFITEKAASPDSVIPAGTVVIEYLGEVDLWESHVENKTNQYAAWGTVKPKVAKVSVSSSENDSSDFVLDSRFVGNEARFIRRSCATTANCEIRPVYIPQLQTFKFLVVTTQPIALKGELLEEELRLPWDWDPQHPISQMIRPNEQGVYEEGKRFEDFSEEERAYLISCVDTILNFVECACNTSNINNQCAIFKVKKATSYLLRSNRKASSLGGLNKSKEELVMPKKIKEYVSWKQRLVERDTQLLETSPLARHLAANEAAEDEKPSAEVSEAADGSEHVKHIRTTVRQNVLAQARKYAVTYEVTSRNRASFDAASISEDLPKNAVAIPLTGEVLAKIKSQVNEAFKPLQRISPNVAVADVKEVKVEKASDADVGSAISPVAEKPTESAAPEKPPVVKKFSFADYKKKKK